MGTSFNRPPSVLAEGFIRIHFPPERFWSLQAYAPASVVCTDIRYSTPPQHKELTRSEYACDI